MTTQTSRNRPIVDVPDSESGAISPIGQDSGRCLKFAAFGSEPSLSEHRALVRRSYQV